jgi:hypothetical protein
MDASPARTQGLPLPRLGITPAQHGAARLAEAALSAQAVLSSMARSRTRDAGADVEASAAAVTELPYASRRAPGGPPPLFLIGGLAGSRIDHGKLRFSPAALSRGVDHEPHVAGRPRAACREGAAEDAIDGRLPSFATGDTSTSR